MVIGTSTEMVWFDDVIVREVERKNDSLIDLKLLNDIGKISNDKYAEALKRAIDDYNRI